MLAGEMSEEQQQTSAMCGQSGMEGAATKRGTAARRQCRGRPRAGSLIRRSRVASQALGAAPGAVVRSNATGCPAALPWPYGQPRSRT
jgi:hypothetical protein